MSGCASSSPSAVDYARLAPIIGQSVATTGGGGELGALADATLLARGGLPVGFDPDSGLVTGSHDGVRYAYAVFCQSLDGVSMTCSPTTGRAYAFVQWDTPAQHRSGMWQLEHLQGDTATATGWGALVHERDGYRVIDDRAEAFRLDLESYQPAHGKIDAALEVTTNGEPVSVTAAISLDGSRKALLTLDGTGFTLDLDTGDVGPVIILR